MQITIAICTWNRSNLLRKTLEQMTRLVVPQEFQWELLVVNNNSTDDTDKVISSFSFYLPIRRLFEPNPGLSNARNQALRHAKGDYILWTDDDVLVNERWLIEYWHAFRHWPEGILFGGPVEPWFAETPPQWLRQVFPQVSHAYAVRDLGTQPIPLSIQGGALPFGANFAVRTEEQCQYLYDPHLGRKPQSSLVGEETALLTAMLEKGAQGWWVPTARVQHYIPQDRQTIRYLRSFFFGVGESEALKTLGDRKSHCFDQPRWMWRAAIEAEVRYRLRRFLSEPNVWIEDLKQASYWWGNLRMDALCPPQR